ncbi:hypothetical protein [Reichenbachiella sp.]|uniref:hypothetical protein n=1 Tax=Reichenbachiella sp. TaxID=2184521 RepID=UPI0032980FB9
MTTNTNAGSVVQTQHNKYMTSYHKGMRHISTVGSIDHTRLGDISYRVFEDFNKENIRIRLPKFSERRTFQMFENQYFRIVSFTTKQWTLGDIQERETVLNSALLFFELEYEMVLPELPTTLYIVENTDQLKKVAKELHNYIIPENSIGYSSMTDQSVVVVTPNFYLGTINHEMVHILLDYSDQKLPGWMEEGLASAYEVSYFDTLELPLDKLPFGYKERLRNRHSERWYNDGRYRDSLHEERLRRDYGYRERWYRDQTRFDFPSGQNRYLDRYDYFYNDQDIIKVPILKPAHNWRHVWLEGYMTQDLGISLKPWNFYYLEKTARKRLIKRLETFSDDRTFYGHLDNERVDVVQQSINIALARYLVMSFLRTENSLREYHFGDLNYRLREEIELIHYRPDRFVEWYIETYWDEPDRTNEDNFEFYRERLEGY